MNKFIKFFVYYNGKKIGKEEESFIQKSVYMNRLKPISQKFFPLSVHVPKENKN